MINKDYIPAIFFGIPIIILILCTGIFGILVVGASIFIVFQLAKEKKHKLNKDDSFDENDYK